MNYKVNQILRVKYNMVNKIINNTNLHNIIKASKLVIITNISDNNYIAIEPILIDNNNIKIIDIGFEKDYFENHAYTKCGIEMFFDIYDKKRRTINLTMV